MATKKLKNPSTRIRDAIAKEVRNGAAISRVGWGLGIPSATIAAWIKAGKSGKGACGKFHRAVMKAEAEFEIEMIGRVWAGGEDWEAAAFLLKCRFPKRWGDDRPI